MGSKVETPDEQVLLDAGICPKGKCTHKTRAEKTQAHGTPSEFEDAIWLACDDGFVTTDEALAAIDQYRSDFYGAPE